MAQPWPPGEEPDVVGADLGTVKPDGAELARQWPHGPPGDPPAEPDVPPARRVRDEGG